MSLHGLAYTVLLAVPAFAVPRPHAHRSLSAHDTCDDIATPHGFQLGIAEGCLSAKSKHCKDVLSIYQICLSPADDDQAAPVASDTASSSGSSTSDSIFATMTPSPNASVVVNLETRTSWTTTTTQTTVYYMVGEGTSTSLQSVVVDYTSTEEVTPTTSSSSLASSTEEITATLTSSSLASSTGQATSTATSSSFTSSTRETTSVAPSSSLASSTAEATSTAPSSSLASSTGQATPAATSSTLASSTLSLTSTSAEPTDSQSTVSTVSSESSVPTTTSSPASTVTPSSATDSLTQRASTCGTAQPHAATQAGIVSDCTQWYIAQSGDYCYSVAERFGISVDTFMLWNPAVDPPSCPSMLAGFAYCVATCDNPQASSVVPTLTSASTAPAPTATGNGLDTYTTFTGNGTVGAGWPEMSEWVDFEYMFAANRANMQASCAAWNVPNDSDEEIADLKTAILDLASSTGVDARFILAIVMQESTGCVRVITTQYSHFNPGLMQSHNGTGSCNTNMAAIGLPGVETEGSVQTPCPYSEIHQMIEDGTAGTSSGDGLQQLLAAQTNTDVSRFYRTARAYNGGSVDPSGDLGRGCCTLCYASDVANRLTGWVDAPHTCNL
ncbi:carbohydrate-binding module family 50 protein [Hortaea werneckii]|nr:carbohydrate-binding module family 50 protein [Hortaea werneckii]KAI7642434.1 carbohydrate-binding module family 50 protein [Hortaea werneckii]KAI7684498.1 carbohydrate-binding module family 50 protein [Hortaea werneckii]